MMHYNTLLAHGTAEEHAAEPAIDTSGPVTEVIPFMTNQSVADRIADLAWFIQLPLFIFCIALIGSMIWLATKKIDTAILVTSLGMLVASFALFEIAPVVSVFAITTGLIATLFVSLIGISTE